jgi:hypothetical protein
MAHTALARSKRVRFFMVRRLPFISLSSLVSRICSSQPCISPHRRVVKSWSLVLVVCSRLKFC